ncbi:hypothetical protein [Hoylesella nanceiensis]|uniref:hypothetical protein n=1 Tax=Hoylesella nanceiensis TaxID=425941 RepID=UPI0027BA9474|nr:hypothetical protein [Hoylesella nanceiensis]
MSKETLIQTKQFAKLILRTAFFMFVRFLLSSFYSALSIKRISIKKEMPRNEAPPFGFVVCLSPLKTGILFQKILLLAFVGLQDKAQAIGF